MRSRVLRTVGVSITALALSTSLVGMASASDPDVTVASGAVRAAIVPTGDAATCYSNLTGDTGFAISSQNFAPADDAVDSEAADDFKLKKTCKIKSLEVLGAYFNGTGPADNETVTFYKNKKGKPGAKITSQKVRGTDNAGSFTIPLKKVVTLEKGTYWVSVVANMDFAEGGQWGWQNTETAKGGPAVWRNPGGGFGTTCKNFKPLAQCIPDAPGTDFMFSLVK